MAFMNARVTPLPAYTPDNWDAEVGQRVKTLLIGRGTQDDIARALGLKQADVSKRINGRVQWKGHELGLVADLFGVSVAVLYGEENKKGPTPVQADPVKLPDLDSNQEPAGSQSAASNRGLAPVTTLKPRHRPAPLYDTSGLITPLHAHN